jgi:acyl-CoA oxidase
VTLGDCGMKTGLQGIDNGFIIFKDYRVPRKNLLNRFSDVLPNGEFTTTIQNID